MIFYTGEEEEDQEERVPRERKPEKRAWIQKESIKKVLIIK